jgi:hypothetical protein
MGGGGGVTGGVDLQAKAAIPKAKAIGDLPRVLALFVAQAKAHPGLSDRTASIRPPFAYINVLCLGEPTLVRNTSSYQAMLKCTSGVSAHTYSHFNATTFFTLRKSGTRLCRADIDPHRACLHA